MQKIYKKALSSLQYYYNIITIVAHAGFMCYWWRVSPFKCSFSIGRLLKQRY